jgi:hypothetical protein
MADDWRVTRETLHAERVDAQHLREQLHDAADRLRRLRALLAARPRREPGQSVRRMRSRGHMQRVVICGAGDAGRRLWEAIAARPTVSVVGFVDAGVRRHGQIFLGAPVQTPDWLRGGHWDHLAVTADESHAWRSWLAKAGIGTNGVIEFPADAGAEALDAIAVASFPDPLAGTLDAAAPISELRIGIFGTGAAGMKVWEVLVEMDTADAVWFADNNRQQQGREILGLDVIAPADIPGRRYDAVVIGSMSREAIHEQLVRLGVPTGRILSPDVAGPIDQLRRQLVSAMVALADRKADREVAV